MLGQLATGLACLVTVLAMFASAVAVLVVIQLLESFSSAVETLVVVIFVLAFVAAKLQVPYAAERLLVVGPLFWLVIVFVHRRA